MSGNPFHVDEHAMTEVNDVAWDERDVLLGHPHRWFAVTAQVGAVAILSLEENKGKTAYFGGINKCRFKGKIVPGDKVKLETKIVKRKGPMGVGEATAYVDGKVVVKAELTFMVG